MRVAGDLCKASRGVIGRAVSAAEPVICGSAKIRMRIGLDQRARSRPSPRRISRCEPGSTSGIVTRPCRNGFGGLFRFALSATAMLGGGFGCLGRRRAPWRPAASFAMASACVGEVSDVTSRTGFFAALAVTAKSRLEIALDLHRLRPVQCNAVIGLSSVPTAGIGAEWLLQQPRGGIKTDAHRANECRHDSRQ